jgi:hypothetical protein
MQADVGAGCAGHQFQRASLVGGERTTRPGQHGGQAGGGIVVVQCAQPEITQFRGEGGERDMWLRLGSPCDDGPRSAEVRRTTRSTR